MYFQMVLHIFFHTCLTVKMDPHFVDVVDVKQRYKGYTGKSFLWFFCLSCLIKQFSDEELVMYYQICGSSGF